MDPHYSNPVIISEQTTPAINPRTGTQFLYLKSDGKVYTKSSGGTEASSIDWIVNTATDSIIFAKKVKPEIATTSTTATSLELDATHSGTVIFVSGVATISLPATSPGVPIGYNVMIIQTGTGAVTVSANGNTLNSFSNKLKLAGQHAAASLICTAANTFNLSGNLITA